MYIKLFIWIKKMKSDISWQKVSLTVLTVWLWWLMLLIRLRADISPHFEQAESNIKRREMKAVHQKTLHCLRCIEISNIFNFLILSEYIMLNNVPVSGEKY